MNEDLVKRALDRIARCKVPSELRTMIKHANREGLPDVARAARLRLYATLPASEPGTLEHDVWQSIHALEETLSEERGKTVRLSRTRPKIARDGELKSVIDLVSKKAPSEGFKMLVERNMIDLTFEAVALRHADRFDADLLARCQARLAEIDE